MEPSVVTPEQLEHLLAINESYLKITQQYGVLKYDQLSVNAQLLDLEAKMMELEIARINAIRELQEQFGTTGTVNLETGAFIPENSQ